VLGITKQKQCKNHMWICKHNEANYGVEIVLKCMCNKGFHKWHKTRRCTYNTKTCGKGVRKYGGSDMDRSNPFGDQTTHFAN
jgi:hypothetical protein